jgi:hypothetical protein
MHVTHTRWSQFSQGSGTPFPLGNPAGIQIIPARSTLYQTNCDHVQSVHIYIIPVL